MHTATHKAGKRIWPRKKQHRSKASQSRSIIAEKKAKCPVAPAKWFSSLNANLVYWCPLLLPLLKPDDDQEGTQPWPARRPEARVTAQIRSIWEPGWSLSFTALDLIPSVTKRFWMKSLGKTEPLQGPAALKCTYKKRSLRQELFWNGRVNSSRKKKGAKNVCCFRLTTQEKLENPFQTDLKRG